LSGQATKCQVQPVRTCLELPGLFNASSTQRPVLGLRLRKLPARGDLQRQWVLSSWGQLSNLLGAVWIRRQLRLQRQLRHQRQLPDRQHCQLQARPELQCGEQRELRLRLVGKFRFKQRQHCQLSIWTELQCWIQHGQLEWKLQQRGLWQQQWSAAV